MVSAAHLVAILCASWCSTCERFRPEFLGADLTDVATHRLWIDIENHAGALPASLDLTSLPMLLIASTSSEAAFFGPVRPYVEVIKRVARMRSPHTGAEELLAAVVARWLRTNLME